MKPKKYAEVVKHGASRKTRANGSLSELSPVVLEKIENRQMRRLKGKKR